MPLYINNSNELNELKEKPFKLEKDIQKIFEVLASLPSILYFTYWLTVYLDLKQAERDKTTDR